jgi:hypothetical protein
VDPLKTAFAAALLAGAFVAISATPPAHAGPGRQEFLACVHGGPGNVARQAINVDDDTAPRIANSILTDELNGVSRDTILNRLETQTGLSPQQAYAMMGCTVIYQRENQGLSP